MAVGARVPAGNGFYPDVSDEDTLRKGLLIEAGLLEQTRPASYPCGWRDGEGAVSQKLEPFQRAVLETQHQGREELPASLSPLPSGLPVSSRDCKQKPEGSRGCSHRLSLPGQSGTERVESKYKKNNFNHSIGLATHIHLHGWKFF